MMRLPNTVPIPAPEPATPTVAAPAPMNLAAVSMSRETVLVWKERVESADWLTGNNPWNRRERNEFRICLLGNNPAMIHSVGHFHLFRLKQKKPINENQLVHFKLEKYISITTARKLK